jgi:hypothetical protein
MRIAISADPFTESNPPPARWPLLACSALLVCLDFILGPAFALPAFYVLPVIWAAWSHGLRLACVLACGLCILRFASHWSRGFPFDFSPAVTNNLLRNATLVIVAGLTARVAQMLRRQRIRIRHLEQNLPVCTSCSLIRHADGRWLPVEAIATEDRPRELLCPDCERRRYDFESSE